MRDRTLASRLTQSLLAVAPVLVIPLAALAPAADEAAGPPGTVAVLKGHTEPVYAISFTPDGKYVITGSFDRTLKMWEAATGKEIKTFGGQAGHQNLVLSLALSPDGQMLASGSNDNTAKIWDLPSGSPIREFAHPDAVNAVALSPDGTKLATAGKDGTVKLWHTADGKQLFNMTGHAGPVTGVAFSASGQMLVSSGADRTLRYWNPANGQAVATVVGHASPITAVTLNPNNAAAYSAAEDGTLKFWQLPIPAPRALPPHADAVTVVALSADGNQVLTASGDKTARLTNFGNGQQIRAFTGATAGITSATLAPNGALVAAGTANNHLLVWNAADAKLISDVTAHAGNVPAVAISPQGNQLLTGGADGLLKTWALPAVPTRLIPHPDGVLAAMATPDGKRLLTGSADKIVRSWNLGANPPQVDRQFAGHTGPVTAVALSPNGQMVASGSADKTIRLWNAANGQQTDLVAGQATITSLQFHPNGQQLLSASEDGIVKIWQIAAAPAKQAQQFKSNGPVRQALFTPKGDLIVSAGDDKLIHVWNAADGKEIKALAGHQGAVNGIAISADGVKIVSASADKTVKVWPMSAASTPQPEVKPVASFTLAGGVQSVAISPNGSRVAAATLEKDDAAVHVLDATTGWIVETLAEQKGAIGSVAFLADNRTVVFAGADKNMRLADVAAQSVLDGHAAGVTGVAYLPNGTQAVTGGADKTVKLWDLAAGKTLKTFGPLPDAIASVVLSRDGAQVAASAGKIAKIWNLADSKELATLSHPANVLSLSFNGDKTRLVTGAADNLTRVWDASTGKELQSFIQAAPVRAVAFHNNNTNVISGSDDKTTVINTTSVPRLIAASPNPVRALAVTPNGSHVLTAGDDKTVKLWNIANGNNERSFTGATNTVNAVAVSKNGILVAAGGADQTVRVYAFVDGKLLGEFKAPGVVRSLAFTPNSQTLAAACEDKSIATWNVIYAAGQPVPAEFGKAQQSFAHAAGVTDLVFGPDNASIYSASLDKSARAWRLAAEAPTKNFGHPNLVDAVAFSNDGKLLATGCHDGVLRIFDVAKGQPVRQINAHTMPSASPIYCVAWSPDSKQILTGSLDHTLKLWDAGNGNAVREFKGFKEKEFEKGHRDGVFCVTFSPDGKQLVSGSSDRTIKVWNVADGSVVRDFVNPNLKPQGNVPPPSHPGWVYGVRFTPDGKYLVSVGGAPQNKGFLAVWNPADGKLLSSEELPFGVFYCVAVSHDGKLLAIGTGAQGRPNQDINTSFVIKMPGAVN